MAMDILSSEYLPFSTYFISFAILVQEDANKQTNKWTQHAIKNKKHWIPTTLNWHFFKKPSSFPTHNSTVNAILNNGFHTFSCEWSLDGDEGMGGRETEKGGRERGARQSEGGRQGRPRPATGCSSVGTSFTELQRGGSRGQVREDDNVRPRNSGRARHAAMRRGEGRGGQEHESSS